MGYQAYTLLFTRFLRGICCLAPLVLSNTVQAQFSDDDFAPIFPYMVKISSVQRFGADKLGFGVIMLEKDGFLYIATPGHIVIDREQPNEPPYETISATLHNADRPIKAELLQKHHSFDLALLRIPKPPWFTWHSNIPPVVAGEGDAVGLLGFEWGWRLKPERGQRHYRVAAIEEEFIYIDTTVEVNMSGGLVVTRNGIAGMILKSSHDTNRAIALNLDYIAVTVLERWLQTDVQDMIVPEGFPRISLDASAGGFFLLTSIDESNPGYILGSGIGIEYFWSGNYGIRFSHFNGRLRSDSKFERTGQSTEFRNDFTINTVYFLYNPQSKLSLLESLYQNKNKSFVYVGYGRGEHDPHLELDDGGSFELDSYSAFEGQYGDDFNLLTLGMRFENPINRYVSWGGDINFTFTDTEYLGIDVDDPFTKNDVADFMLGLSFYLNVVFGREPPPDVLGLYRRQ